MEINMDDYILLKYFKSQEQYEPIKHEMIDKFNKFVDNEKIVNAKDVIEPLSEEHAEKIVSKMYHNEQGITILGERYSLKKAKEICEEYKGKVKCHPTYTEVYIAINAQYHDYINLYKSWFNVSAETKIIESAMEFWFNDIDYKGNKIRDYFLK